MSSNSKALFNNPLFHLMLIMIIIVGVYFIPEEFLSKLNLNTPNQAPIESSSDHKSSELTTVIKNIPNDTIIEEVKEIKEEHQIISSAESKHEIQDDSTLFYDFSDNSQMRANLLERLSESSKRKVRIAVMGDSFIEGDIVTMDIRKQLQNKYSGGGVGFMPVTSLAARYRKTIKHNFSKDWDKKCITITQDSVYTISGEVFTPNENSWVSYEATKIGKNKLDFNSARLLFINKNNSTIKIAVNDEEPVIYTPNASDELQEIKINKQIDKIEYTFSNVEGLTVYGSVFDDNTEGISVDNYSIRGNLGITMNHVSQKLSKQLSNILPYDMIILQYGLNIVEDGRVSYDGYYKSINTVVKHIKKCYPDVPILIAGISERSVLTSNDVVPMPGVLEVNELQKKLSQENKVMFWSTLKAMHKHGGMKAFTENKWASKDYTHINMKGGAIIAKEFYNSIFR